MSAECRKSCEFLRRHYYSHDLTQIWRIFGIFTSASIWCMYAHIYIYMYICIWSRHGGPPPAFPPLPPQGMVALSTMGHMVWVSWVRLGFSEICNPQRHGGYLLSSGSGFKYKPPRPPVVLWPAVWVLWVKLRFREVCTASRFRGFSSSYPHLRLWFGSCWLH